MARAVRGLPRAVAPRDGSIDFATVMAAVDDRLETELARADADLRPIVAPLARVAMPAETVAATLAALQSQPRLLPRSPVLTLLRRAAALIAAAGVVAAALLARPGATCGGATPPAGSLDAQAAQLTTGDPIGVEFVEADPGSPASAPLRAIGGGVPRLDRVPAARPPKTRGGP